MNQTKRKHSSVRRVFTIALAAALSATCLVTVALAASPELRTAVLSFFRMEEREQVPNSGVSPDGPDISNAEIGALVKAQYIKMDSYRYGYSAGLLNNLTWSDDWKTLVDAKFWEARDNELIPVEVEMQTSQVNITHNDLHYQGEFYWFVRDGQLSYFAGDNRDYDEEQDIQTDWNLSPIPGRTDALILRLAIGTQMERRESSLLYHLDTGETEDLFAGVDPGVMEESDGAIWSPNARRALITGRASAEFPNGREWLYDRETRTLTDVKDLGGVGADMALFVDDDTLILPVYTYGPEYDSEGIACWVYDIPSGQAIQTLPQSPYYREQDEDPYGVIPFYGGWCMEIGEDGSACLVNLVTGERTVLENFTFQRNMDFWLNPAGNKLLYHARDSKSEGLGISQLGVIDLEQMTFIAFDREGYENLREGGICWESDNTISIEARTQDGETHYLLLYQF